MKTKLLHGAVKSDDPARHAQADPAHASGISALRTDSAAAERALMGPVGNQAAQRPGAAAAPADPGTGGVLQRECAGGGGAECARCGEEEEEQERLQRSPEASGQAMPPSPGPAVHETLRTSGENLDARLRGAMEPHFAADFSGVRVHADARAARSADSVGANAYTDVYHIVFANGKFAPETAAGRKLIAHELTH
ncbi:MAG TPA: DUF4157 domain-containing protein, partial [Myxococcota bacterium]|nr:DUF4157 domain-containing protein [Myxococcota bacterium]